MGQSLLGGCVFRPEDVRKVDVCGSQLGFVVVHGNVWFEVSGLVGEGKDVEKWLLSEEAEAFMGALTEADMVCPAVFKFQKIGGEVWLHEDMAVEYARWLSPEAGIGLRYALYGIPTCLRPCMDVVRRIYSQEQTGVLKASGRVSVDDGYAVMLPYLLEWIGGYDITVLSESEAGEGVESPSTYLMFKRFLDRRHIPYTEPGLYVSKFLKEIGIPYTRNTGSKGWRFMVTLKEKYAGTGEEA